MPPSIAEIHAMLTGPGSPFEIAEQEIRGVPTRIWAKSPPSLRAVLDLSRLHADRIFLVYEDERLSFEEHWRRAAALATKLVDELGVRKGDRVAIAMRNFPEWSLAFWAAGAVGAIVVPLNAWWTGEELQFGLEDCGARVLFADAERAERIAPHAASLPALERVAIARAEPGAALPMDALRFEDLVGEPGADVAIPEVAIEPDDDATIFYTSGTTGKPKGALGTHRNITSNLPSVAFGQARAALRAGAELGALAGPRPQPAQLISVPFFHATGCHAMLCANTAFGGKIVMMYKWDPERALELIEREKITTFGGVPAMVWQVLESPSFKKRDLSSVKGVGYGGAPAAPELVRRIKEAFPDSAPSQGYGLTETSAVTTLNSGVDYERKPDSVGVPVPVCEIRIMSERGEEMPVGQPGEIWIKGPNVVKGYWRRPEATAETFPDGWLRSGDVGRVDDEGFLYIMDRAKDMLIRGGENVYCVEVEAALYQHAEVMDAAVVGIPHRVLGEEVGAVVQVTPGAQVSPEELRGFVREHLAAFKVPKIVEIRQEPLPRNANGKILKRQLKDEMARHAEA